MTYPAEVSPYAEQVGRLTRELAALKARVEALLNPDDPVAVKRVADAMFRPSLLNVVNREECAIAILHRLRDEARKP